MAEPEQAVRAALTLGRARSHARVQGRRWAVLQPTHGRVHATEAPPEWTVGQHFADGTVVLAIAEPPAGA